MFQQRQAEPPTSEAPLLLLDGPPELHAGVAVVSATVTTATTYSTAVRSAEGGHLGRSDVGPPLAAYEAIFAFYP